MLAKKGKAAIAAKTLSPSQALTMAMQHPPQPAPVNLAPIAPLSFNNSTKWSSSGQLKVIRFCKVASQDTYIHRGLCNYYGFHSLKLQVSGIY